MSREWRPGDVADIPFSGGTVRAMWVDGRGWVCADGGHDSQHYFTYPLVVISPEDREQAERLADALLAAMCKSDPDWDRARAYEVRSHMQAALREFANPTPDEVYRHFVSTKDGGVLTALCGKVWRRNADANVNVVGACPECASRVADGWAS